MAKLPLRPLWVTKAKITDLSVIAPAKSEGKVGDIHQLMVFSLFFRSIW